MHPPERFATRDGRVVVQYEAIKARNLDELASRLNALAATGWRRSGEVQRGTGAESYRVLIEKEDDSAPLQVLHTANGAIDVRTHTVVLGGAGSRAMTLATPTAEQNGVRLLVMNINAEAHSITTPGADTIVDSYSGGIGNRYTTYSQPGLSAMLEAHDGKWYMSCSLCGGNNVTDV
jgi:hypothetical protein